MNELPVAAAVDRLRALVQPIAGMQDIPVMQATGRVLAQPVVAQVDLPAFDNSAMDGYALRSQDLGRPVLREVGLSTAGHGHLGSVQAGECVRIMTGAPVPAGADTVVMLEDTKRSDAGVQILRSPAPGANVRRRGEHVIRGATVLPRGCRLGPAEVALAASVGSGTVDVIRPARVGVASTGDELADPPTPLATAGSYDANRPLLLTSLQRLGMLSVDLGICPDRADAFAALLERALVERLDALVISGGAAQGDADIVRQAAEVAFLPLDIRPGRGLAYALIERDGHRLALLGLPGNAVAAFVMFHLVARPLLLHLAGASERPLPQLQLPLADEARTRGGRVDYQRGRIVAQDGRAVVTLLADQGSAMLRTVVEADALVAIGPAPHTPAGALVRVIPLGMLN
ncbi:MAG: molybdopterin molybdotransferase MoeA [Burkholderiales bacterium]|nr:molybdopterin molybdotransferase MoeA [Burkholderiales bacterium]